MQTNNLKQSLKLLHIQKTFLEENQATTKVFEKLRESYVYVKTLELTIKNEPFVVYVIRPLAFFKKNRKIVFFDNTMMMKFEKGMIWTFEDWRKIEKTVDRFFKGSGRSFTYNFNETDSSIAQTSINF